MARNFVLAAIRFGQRHRPGCHSFFERAVQAFELHRFPVELDEDTDLRAQDFRNHGTDT
jgi:hypothetical protein